MSSHIEIFVVAEMYDNQSNKGKILTFMIKELLMEIAYTNKNIYRLFSIKKKFL